MPGPNRAFQAGPVKPKHMRKTMGRLLGYLTRSKLPLAAVLLCLLASVAANLGGSYLMRPIINRFIWSGCTDFAGLGLSMLQLAGVYLLGCLAAYGQSAIMVRLAERGVNRLRKDLFDRLQRLPLSYFDQHPHGELMSRFSNDADSVLLALQQSVVSLLSSCLMFVGLVALMLFINWKLFFITAAVLALTLLLFKTMGGRSRRFYQKQQAALGAVNGEILHPRGTGQGEVPAAEQRLPGRRPEGQLLLHHDYAHVGPPDGHQLRLDRCLRGTALRSPGLRPGGAGHLPQLLPAGWPAAEPNFPADDRSAVRPGGRGAHL